MIEVNNVTISQSGKKLFQNFNWKINGDESWIIKGANGSGKTSLLELLAGVIHPVEGDINYSFISGVSWEERYQQRKQKIHYLPVDAALSQINQHDLFYQQRYYSLGDEFVPTVKELLGEEVVNQIQRFNFPASLSIDHLLNLKVTRLSNGQSKKVMILKNLAQQIPTFLLLDYPFEALDRQSRKELKTFLDFLATEHRVQLIMTNHDSDLPSSITHQLILADFRITEVSPFPSTPSLPNYELDENNKVKQSDIVVEMKELTIQYGEVTIIKNLNWAIRKGERWALTGKNGSGKTTLFSLIFADHPMAYSEKVYLFGKRRGTGESIWDIKNRVSYLGPEQMTFANTKNNLVNTREFILSQTKNASEETFSELIDHFQIHSFLDQPLRILSSGQLQLVFIISCFLSQKELILLDEPFRFLDPIQKERVNHCLQNHLDENTTLVMITHDEKDLTQWGKQVMDISSPSL